MNLSGILKIIRYLPWTIYFNFHYLPLKQARLLPILLYKPKLLSMRGKVKIVGGGETGLDSFGISQC